MSDALQWPLPPHARLTDLLPPQAQAALLDWVLSHEAAFKPGTVTSGTKDAPERIDPKSRIGLVLRDLGPLRETISRHLLAALPELMAATGISGPEPRSLELELAAHGDGAHYEAHVDISLGPDRRPLGATATEDRVLSAVYYFHREPKGFSGGALRLFRFGAHLTDQPDADGIFIDLEPLQNSLIAFPPWATHEVRPIRCPSGAFADYRFALNCWYCREL